MNDVPSGGGGKEFTSPYPPAEHKYRSENKTPSIKLQPRSHQYSPLDFIGPFPDHEPEDVPSVGNEGDRAVEGDNPPPLPVRHIEATNAVGCPGVTDLTAPKKTGSASVTSFFGGR